LRATWRELAVRADPACPVCGEAPTVRELIDYEDFCGLPSAATDPDHLVRPAADDRAISARELEALLKARAEGSDDFLLVDVREPGERAIVSIPGAVAVPMADFTTGAAWQQLPFNKKVILHCRSGARSAECLGLLQAAGHHDAWHVDGGVLAWVQDVDPSLPVY
jgi:sulfur-carrier protein adenylyltransferase/sulfurtransferase